MRLNKAGFFKLCKEISILKMEREKQPCCFKYSVCVFLDDFSYCVVLLLHIFKW